PACGVSVESADPALARHTPKARDYPRRASLSALADATAAALRAQPLTGGTSTATASASPTATSAATTVTVRIDDSLFSGPSVSPDWPATYVSSGVVSRVSA